MPSPEPQSTIEDRGPSEPELAVVVGIHGDEPSGVRAVERLLDAGLSLQRGVRFVIANPAAVAADERYLDADLNRVFPGDPGSDDREGRLTARLCTATSGLQAGLGRKPLSTLTWSATYDVDRELSDPRAADTSAA